MSTKIQKTGSVPDLKRPQYQVVRPEKIPLEDFFSDWELIDWHAISKEIAQGNAVLINGIEGRFETQWIGCAIRQLGLAQVHVLCIDSTLLIAPKKLFDGVLLDGQDYDDS